LVSSTQSGIKSVSSTHSAAVPVSSTQASTDIVYGSQPFADPHAQLNATITTSDDTCEDQATPLGITSTMYPPLQTQSKPVYVPSGTFSSSTPTSYYCPNTVNGENDSTYVVSETLRNQWVSPVVS
jgi:hypothetical protein